MNDMHSAERLTRFAACLLVTIPLFVVGGCGPDKEIRKLISDLRDEDPEERHDAVKELENIGVRAAHAVPALAKCLRDEDEKVRYRAAKTLAKMGLASKKAIGELGAALANDSNEKVRYYSAKALDEIADHVPDEVAVVVPDLTTALSAENAKTRYYTIKTLGKIGADAYSAIEALEEYLNDSDESVRKAADSAIRRIRKKHAES